MPTLEKIVRGIIVHDQKILLCKNLAGGHYFLPGGHIEGSESPEIAFRRELDEEIGRSPKEIKYITEVSNSYVVDNEKHDEVFYIYLATLDDYGNIQCKETHIDFEWVPISNFMEVDFKPKQVMPAILKIIEENADFYKK